MENCQIVLQNSSEVVIVLGIAKQYHFCLGKYLQCKLWIEFIFVCLFVHIKVSWLSHFYMIQGGLQ